MKKIIVLFVMGVLLVSGCSPQTSVTQEVSTPTPTPNETTSAPVETTSTPIESSTDLTEEYLNQMEEYELLRYGFLGTINSEHNLEEVIERASTFDGLEFVKELKEDSVYYGKRGEESDNVYLLVPKKDVGLKIGEYSWYADEIVESYYYEGEGGKPILFIESSEQAKPISRVLIETGRDSLPMYTGFNITTGMLRTAFLMGVVDITPYEKFTTAEVPSYSQAIFDIMQSVPEIMEIEENGGSVSMSSEEFFFEDEIYAHIYTRDKDGNDVYYGISPSTGSVVKTKDHVEWTIVK